MTCFIPCKNRRKHQIETRQYSSVNLWLWDICHIRRSLNQMGQVYPGSSLLGSLSKLCQTPTLCYVAHEQLVLGFFWKGKVSSKSECKQTDNNHISHVESLQSIYGTVLQVECTVCKMPPKVPTGCVKPFRDFVRAVAQFWERKSGQNETSFYFKKILSLSTCQSSNQIFKFSLT